MANLKNIVIIYDQPYYSGGAAKIAIDSAIYLSKIKKYNVIFFSAINNISKELLESNVEVITLDEKHIGKTKNPVALLKGIYNRKSYIKLNELLDTLDKNETIIHVHGWTKALSSSIFKSIREKEFKCVITLHEFFTVCQNGGLYNFKKQEICNKEGVDCFLCNCDKKNYFYKIYRNIRQIIQKHFLNKCKPNLIFVTNFSKEIIESKINYSYSSKFVLNNFVDIYNNKRIKCEENKKYAFIGRITEEKGIDKFCQIIDEFSLQGIVIGDGPLLVDYKNKYPKIEFTGWKNKEEMRELLTDIRCLIITSKWYETMGLTAVELQGCGVPVICPIHCAAKENIEDGINGFLYDINKLETLKNIILKLEDDSNVKEISKNIYKNNNLKKHSIEEQISRLQEIYITIMEDKK